VRRARRRGRGRSCAACQELNGRGPGRVGRWPKPIDLLAKFGCRRRALKRLQITGRPSQLRDSVVGVPANGCTIHLESHVPPLSAQHTAGPNAPPLLTTILRRAAALHLGWARSAAKGRIDVRRIVGVCFAYQPWTQRGARARIQQECCCAARARAATRLLCGRHITGGIRGARCGCWRRGAHTHSRAQRARFRQNLHESSSRRRHNKG
jgi:hypothetical protein